MEILESEKNSLELLEARLTESKLAEYIQLGTMTHYDSVNNIVCNIVKH
jgi:hypothetical protein